MPEWVFAALAALGVLGTGTFVALWFGERKRFEATIDGLARGLGVIETEVRNTAGLVEREALRVLVDLNEAATLREMRILHAVQELRPAIRPQVGAMPSPERAMTHAEAEATKARIEENLRAAAARAGRTLADSDVKAEAKRIYAEHGSFLRSAAR